MSPVRVAVRGLTLTENPRGLTAVVAAGGVTGAIPCRALLWSLGVLLIACNVVDGTGLIWLWRPRRRNPAPPEDNLLRPGPHWLRGHPATH